MDTLDLSAALATALRASQLGRQVLLDYFGRLKKVQDKAQAGLVSEADVESEKVITAELKRGFPGVSVLGEEESYLTKQETIESNMWVVDPLDGTTNYVHSFPIFCISIGLQWQGQLKVGVIDVPMLNKTYTAVQGQGAFVNGVPIHASTRATIKESLLSTGFFPDNVLALKEQLQIFSDLVYEARGIRRPGAAAYDLCLVAEGVFDAFWEKNLKPWDSAAGCLLVREAGGFVSDYRGRSQPICDETVLAANDGLHSKLHKLVAGTLKPATRAG